MRPQFRFVLWAALGASTVLPAAEPPQEVVVVNLPEVQSVAGSVRVEGHPDAARLLSFEEIVLPPSAPDSPARMVSPGVLEGAGFRSVVASLAGSLSTPMTRGQVGVLLVPEIDLAMEAIQRRGQLVLGHRFETDIQAADLPYFSAGPVRFDLAFPRYRVFLFNTGERAVEANVYLYLTD